MTSSKNLIIICAAYNIVVGITMIIVSISAIMSYFCLFNYQLNPHHYMMYLMYFKASNCDGLFRWSLLEVKGISMKIQPEVPNETFAVLKTFIFSIVYLVMNTLLVITSFRALFGLRPSSNGRHYIYYVYFVPWIVTQIFNVILDITGTTVYALDYIKSFTVDGLMDILEIKNTISMYRVFARILDSFRQAPSLIFLGTSSKFLVFLITNIVLIFISRNIAWKVCSEIKRDYMFNGSINGQTSSSVTEYDTNISSQQHVQMEISTLKQNQIMNQIQTQCQVEPLEENTHL